MTPPPRLRWGVVATGRIAGKCVRALRDSSTAAVVAVASRDPDRAAAFAAEHGIARSYGSYAELYADPEVDGVYIAPPHPQHHDNVLAAAAAGKHIICEKPLGVTLAEAERMIAAVRAADVFFLEAFRYRFHPQTFRLLEWIGAGEIGELRQIHAAYGFTGDHDPAGRLLDPMLAGGGILDVGCYPISMVRLLAGAARGEAFADPVSVQGCGHIGATGVDEHASALLLFADDLIAQVQTGIKLPLGNTVTAWGSAGHIHVAWPWNPEIAGDEATISLVRPGRDPLVERVVAADTLWALEFDQARLHLDERQSPHMSWADSLGNMRTLDAWRRAIGLRLPMDEAP